MLRLNKRLVRKIKLIPRMLFSKQMIPIWICVIGVIMIFVLVASLGKEKKNVLPQDAEIYKNEIITVGVESGISGLSMKNEKTGELYGFNIDLMNRIMKDIFPNKKYEFTEIKSQQASYLLKTGEIDIAVGALTSGVTKTLKLKLSDPYYYEKIYAYSPEKSRISTYSEIIGKRIYATTTEFTKKSLEKALKEKGIETYIIGASSYPDLNNALETGRADAVFAMECFSYKFVKHNFQSDEPVMTAGLRIAAWTDYSNTILLINDELEKLKKDETLKELMIKWGLEE